MTEQWCVVCPVTAWESVPLTKADAEELLEEPTLLHPFESTCRSTHYLAEYKGDA